MSSKTVQFTIEKLSENLFILIDEASAVEGTKTYEKHMLVGKTVLHTFEEKDDKILTKRKILTKKKYKGYEISTVPHFNHRFNIKYQDDPAIYTYKLLDEMKNGDFEIVV
ncbi:hypothetical protein ACJMK2_032620 [Sinanodonta woodiana]|uniref:Uncharacterized protein n=1 Tax=Sinanodonta woodiana TaxID=1069815 RepID=A0ABD3X451_SINWO